MVRTNQKERTRSAIVAAARDLVESGADVTMPDIAAAARVSEATAYRYFPHLAVLLGEVVVPMDTDAAMEEVAASADPVERVAHAAEALSRRVIKRERAVRAVIAATIAGSGPPARPGHRFPLIKQALAPWSETADPAEVEQLTRSLAVVISAEALFTLIDMCDLAPEAAIQSLIQTARTLTAATIGRTEHRPTG